MPEFSPIQIFYTVLLATTFLTQGLIAAWVYRYQWGQSGAKWFLIMVGTGMVWVLPYTFFFVVTNPTYQYAAHVIGFFGALSTVCAFVVFASTYTEAGFHHNRLIQAHLVAIIGGYLLLAPTNNMHHLLFANFRAVSEPFSYIAVQRGVVFWGMLLSLQIPGLYAYYHLVTNLRSSQRHGGRQLIMFTFGALSINTLDYVDHLTTLLPMEGFPDALLGMFVFYVFVAVALFRFNLLDAKPVARETVIENLHDPVLVIEEQNRLVDFNEAATAVWPALPDRLLDPFETACPEVEATIETPLEGTFTTELTIERDGVEHHYLMTASAVTADGAETGWYSIVLREITDRREREEELRKREHEIERAHEQLRQIIDLVPDPLYVKNLDDEVLLSNEANAELHEMTPEEIEGKREFDIESDVENIENFDQYRQREIEVIETGESTTFEEELLDPDGNTRMFKMTRIPFKTWGTDEDAVLGYARDVTDLKEYEQELEETKRTLEESNERLDQFASIVSHDLRNPLQVADSTLALVEETGNLNRLGDARTHLTRMEELIDDLLTMARAGDTIEETEPVPLADAVSESWTHADTASAELKLTVPEDATVMADRNRLLQVFENLFRNAVDHNDLPLTVRVGLLEAPEGNPDDGQQAGFFVEDDGEGVPADERDEVFEHGHTTSDEGTGFGLSIVTGVVDAHDWDISIAESDEGGARFEIIGVEIVN